MNANHMTIGFIGLGLIGGSIAKQYEEFIRIVLSMDLIQILILLKWQRKMVH